MQALAELRYIDKQPDQLHITGIKNGTAHRSVALNYGIFPVRMTTGIPIGRILGNSCNHNGLVLLILLPDGRLHGFCCTISENSGSVCAKFGFVGVDGLLCLMVDGAQGILLMFGAALRDSRDRHIMLIPQPFHILLQLVCRNPAHFYAACSRNWAGGQMQLQLCGGCFGILTV